MCWYNPFMVWQNYGIRITQCHPECYRLGTQIIRPECGKLCGGKAKMLHRVSPASCLLSPLESIYLPSHTLVTLISRHTSTSSSAFPTLHLYKNIQVSGPCAGAGSGAVKPRPHLLNHYHPALILLSTTRAFTQSS